LRGGNKREGDDFNDFPIIIHPHPYPPLHLRRTGIKGEDFLGRLTYYEQTVVYLYIYAEQGAG